VESLKSEKSLNQEEVKKVIYKKLHDLFENPTNNSNVNYEIDELLCDPKTGIYTKESAENAAYFFQEIITITEKYRDSKPEKLKTFIEILDEIFFHYSPNIFNYLNLSPGLMLEIVAKVNRYEELRGYIGQNIVGEAVYEINFNRSGVVEEIIKHINSLPVGEREDVIHQIETLYSGSVANSSWSYESVDKLRIILGQFTKSNRPLTRIVAGVAQERFENEDEDSSTSVFTYKGNKSSGRLYSLENTDGVSDKIQSNLPMGYLATIASSDVLIAKDYAGMPRFGARVENASDIKKLPDTGIRAIQGLEKIKEFEFSQIDLRTLVNKLSVLFQKFEPQKTVSEFYAPILGVDIETMKAVIESGEDILPYFKADWILIRERIFNLINDCKKQILDKNIPNIEFEKFEDISKGDDRVPFISLNKNEQVLIAQMMRPEVRSNVEGELGINLEEISFRSQVHLYRFLAQENQ